jgi:hypothetical protein
LTRAIFAVAALALIGATPALACSCLPRSEAQIIEAADVAVAGKVSDVRRIGPAGSGSVIATIEVTRIIKGRVHRQIQVRTRDNPAACGIDFQTGSVVRVAAQKLNDGLNTNLCMALAAPRA